MKVILYNTNPEVMEHGIVGDLITVHRALQECLAETGIAAPSEWEFDGVLCAAGGHPAEFQAGYLVVDVPGDTTDGYHEIAVDRDGYVTIED